MALRRFIADRGHPTTIYSDNGTNLVAGEKELREGIVNLNSKLVTEEMIDRGINWKFSPPSGPHFGGSWERLVGSSKKSLRAVLEERSVNDEVLLTVLKEVASLLNTRPLTHVSSDPSEPEPLTPNHFILGCHHPHYPPDVEEAFCGLTRRRYRQSQFIVNQYWRRWMREYVPNLIDRKKWNQATPSLRVGNRVLIMDENTRRGQWLTGTVSKLFPGEDGRIRRVSVKTATSELTRPVVKLCLFSDA
jgi:transposase InsO family protein